VTDDVPERMTFRGEHAEAPLGLVIMFKTFLTVSFGGAVRPFLRSLWRQQFSFWWTGVRPKGHTGLEKDLAAILGRLGLIQGRDGGARQPAERRAALL
jgi:hypothetical protein